MIANVVWGALGIGLAFAMIKWRMKILEFTGTWSWAEKYCGGTHVAIVLFALLTFFASIAKMLGKLDTIFADKPIGGF